MLKRIFAVDAAVVVNGGDVVTGLVISAVGDLRNLASAVGADDGGGDEANKSNDISKKIQFFHQNKNDSAVNGMKLLNTED